MIDMRDNTKISNVVCHSCVREYNLFLTTKDTTLALHDLPSKSSAGEEHKGSKPQRARRFMLAIFAPFAVRF
jgi:hypothetical protein